MSNRNKKFYITTSIAYTNAPPHLGFSLELIQADVIARYHRLLAEDVFFLTGTDEHGAKVAKAAAAEGRNIKEFVDEISEKFRTLRNVLNLSNDDFIRTTDKNRHWPAVKKIWLKLKQNGDIYKKKYQGFYCSGCEAFITKKDLVGGKCTIHQKEPEKIEEENYFFRLAKYSKEIEELIEREEIKIIPEGRKNEILKFIKQGLEDISFSRPRKDLKWAIPVPDDEQASIYVWADALSSYVSVLGYFRNSAKFRKFWPADVHCIGKDILRFHTAIWPGMLLSLGLELPKIIFVHGFITVNSQKMSKSLGNIIDPFELVKKYGSASSPQAGADAVRYFLLREIPPAEDGDFTYEKFEKRYNSDLAGGLGNLVARVMAMAKKFEVRSSRFDVRCSKFEVLVQNSKLKKEIKTAKKKLRKALIEFKFNEALIAVWDLIHFCDRYIEKERPWEKSEKQPLIINNLLITLANIAEMLQPFMPETSEKIFKQLGIKPGRKTKIFSVKKGEPLFPRIN